LLDKAAAGLANHNSNAKADKNLIILNQREQLEYNNDLFGIVIAW
jgi:hypothetical protein